MKHPAMLAQAADKGPGRPQERQRLPDSRLSVEYRALDSLEPYARNAKRHSAAQVGQIAESIRRFGWTNPVLIDASGGIVAGHGRVLAAKKLGMNAVPVIVLEHMTEEQRRAYVLADNRLNELSDWDKGLLMDELRELSSSGFDLEFLDFGALDGDLAQFQERESETPEDRRDREEGPSERKAEPIQFPVYVVLDAAQNKRWQALKGDRSDKDFLGILIERGEAVRAYLDQLEDAS